MKRMTLPLYLCAALFACTLLNTRAANHVVLPGTSIQAKINQANPGDSITIKAMTTHATVADSADVAKAIALGADAIALGHSVLMALNCNKDIPEANYQDEMGVEPGYCYHCHTGRCPVGVATQDPALRVRLNPDEAAERVYNFLHTLTIEAQLFARACGKTNVHSLEPEDLAALTMEASAMAGVPLAGTEYTVGVKDYHHL